MRLSKIRRTILSTCKSVSKIHKRHHSICEDIEKRRILLENLQDEENKDGDHPKLWKNFAKSLGADEKILKT